MSQSCGQEEVVYLYLVKVKFSRLLPVGESILWAGGGGVLLLSESKILTSVACR